MATSLNSKSCIDTKRGTGLIDCNIQFGVPTGFFLVPKTWTLDPETDTFDNAYVTARVKAREFVPFLNSIGFEPTAEEAEIFTTQTKIQIKSVDGKYGYSFDFSNGYYFHSAAWSYNSFNRHNILITYDSGVVVGARTSTDNWKGQTAGIVNTSDFMDADGTDPEKTTIMFQLTNPNERNTQLVPAHPSETGLDLNLVVGITDVNIKKISNATTDVVITVKASANESISIGGLTENDFRAIGTTQTITSVSYDDATEEYTLTFSGDVSADYPTLVIETYDTADQTTVVESSGALYSGRSKN